jgi:hypothetical protein
MKKKFRQITIDGDDSWAWAVHDHGDYYRTKVLKIWKDKKIVYTFGEDEVHTIKPYSITPGLVARFIKTHLIS